jgi:hypothetical protein
VEGRADPRQRPGVVVVAVSALAARAAITPR